MKEIVYEQDRQLSSETYVLRETSVSVRGRQTYAERTFQLSLISSDCSPIKRRFSSLYLVPFSLFGISCAAGWWLLAGANSFFRELAGIVLIGQAPFMLLMLKFAPVEGVRFVDIRGKILFEIYRPFKNVFKYDEFVRELNRRIADSRASPTGSTSPTESGR